MEIKKLIKSIKNAFDINVSKKEKKKDKIKELIKELKIKRRDLKNKIKTKRSKQKIQDLQEDCEIITLQIRKSKRILRNLKND